MSGLIEYVCGNPPFTARTYVRKTVDGKKDGCLVIPLGRNGGECIALVGKYFSRGG